MGMAESTVPVPSLGAFTSTGGWITEGPEKIAPIVVWGMGTEPEPDEPHGGVKPPGPEPRRYPYPVIGNGLPDAEFPRAEVLWLAERLQRSEYERGQLKAENRRLLRRLRKLRHKGKR